MADRHYVKFKVPNRELGNSDIVFVAYERLDDDSLSRIGELRVSVGGIEWRGSRQRRSYTYQQSWTEFDKLLESTISRRRKQPREGPEKKRRRPVRRKKR